MTNPTPIPACDHADPAQLAAWYGPFGYADHYRKVTLAHCREIVRAAYAARAEKVTEARIDDLARLHDGYLDFLVNNLAGRTAYERQVREQIGA